MTLEQLQDYYIGQRFIIACDSYIGHEVFELHVRGFKTKHDNEYVTCYYNYLENPNGAKKSGIIDYTRWNLDDMIRDCWNEKSSWRLLGWIPIKPLNDLPEELFTI